MYDDTWSMTQSMTPFFLLIMSQRLKFLHDRSI